MVVDVQTYIDVCVRRCTFLRGLGQRMRVGGPGPGSGGHSGAI